MGRQLTDNLLQLPANHGFATGGLVQLIALGGELSAQGGILVEGQDGIGHCSWIAWRHK